MCGLFKSVNLTIYIVWKNVKLDCFNFISDGPLPHGMIGPAGPRIPMSGAAGDPYTLPPGVSQPAGMPRSISPRPNMQQLPGAMTRPQGQTPQSAMAQVGDANHIMHAATCCLVSLSGFGAAFLHSC